MDMDEKFRQELANTLKELKDFLLSQKTRRSTDVIPRIENITLRLLSEQKEKCTISQEKNIEEKLRPTCRDLKRLEERLQKLSDEIYNEFSGFKNGSKTTTNEFRTLNGRVGSIEERLAIPGQDDSYEVRLKDLEDWMEEEEEKRGEEAARSARYFGRITTIISIVLALLFGVSSLVMGIIQLVSS